MPTTPFNTYDIQLASLNGWPEGAAALGAGGSFIVTAAGSPVKLALVDPEAFTPIANPVVPVRGKLRFGTAATVLAVDLYGFAADGSFIVRRGVTPGGINDILYDTMRVQQVAVVPFALADYAAGAERDTLLDFPAGALVLPTVAVRVTTNQAARTIDVGLLSSESGGDADGFIVAASLAALGTVPGLLVGTDTLGALLKEDTNGSSVLVPRPFPIATAVSLTLTISTGATAGAGFLYIPYLRLVN